MLPSYRNMARVSHTNVTSASSKAKQDGDCRRKSRWMCWIVGLRRGVTETVHPSAGPAAPEQPAAGTAHRGHRDHPELPLLRWDQPAAIGKQPELSPSDRAEQPGSRGCCAPFSLISLMCLSRGSTHAHAHTPRMSVRAAAIWSQTSCSVQLSASSSPLIRHNRGRVYRHAPSSLFTSHVLARAQQHYVQNELNKRPSFPLFQFNWCQVKWWEFMGLRRRLLKMCSCCQTCCYEADVEWVVYSQGYLKHIWSWSHSDCGGPAVLTWLGGFLEFISEDWVRAF